MSTIILVLWLFGLTVIELSALLNDSIISGGFVKPRSHAANLIRVLLWRPVPLLVLVGVGLCSFQLGSTNFLQMPHFLAAIASGVDCSAFVRAVAILSTTPVAGVRSLWWFFLVVDDAVNSDRVFLCFTCYKKRVLCRILLTSCELDRSCQVKFLLL